MPSLCFLAVRIARSHELAQATIPQPFGLIKAAAFQAINPKAWVFALGAMTTFRPVDLPTMTGAILVAITMVMVVVPAAAIWVVGGGVLGRFIAGGRSHRIASFILAALLAASVASVWI